jgi:protein-serine/threonine kinase
MDNQGNRLYLNFDNNGGRNGDRLATPSDSRAYPTTPSTFPQPDFPSTSGQPPSSSSGLSAQPNQYATGYTPAGYFMQNQYPSQYPAQPPASSRGVPQYDGAAEHSYLQPRSNTPGSNDPNTGLAHQFSHQNLGGAARASPYGGRGPSPAQRPRTAGASAQQTNYSYLNAPPLPGASASSGPEFQPAPERNPDKYGPNANNNQKKCSQLAADFFKDSVKRARERNQR